MTKREDLNQQVAIREDVILEMLTMDNVPPDMITAVALIALGIRMHHDILEDTERLAIILEQWADGVRHGQYIGPRIVDKKRG